MLCMVPQVFPSATFSPYSLYATFPLSVIPPLCYGRGQVSEVQWSPVDPWTLASVATNSAQGAGHSLQVRCGATVLLITRHCYWQSSAATRQCCY